MWRRVAEADKRGNARAGRRRDRMPLTPRLGQDTMATLFVAARYPIQL